MNKNFWYQLGKKHGGGGSGGGGGGGEAIPTVDIMGEVQFSDFAETPGFGMISMHTFGVDGFEAFEIVEGENYTVVWNGVEYKVKAVDSGSFIPGSLLLGNGAPANLPGKDEPFAIGWTSSAVTFFSFDGKTSNTARIYKTVFDNAEEPSVALDFTNGNQIIRPSEDGKLIDEVVIEKPGTLIPEFVAYGIDIAGVMGKFKGGGDVKVALGYIQKSELQQGMTFTHGLGVMPDIIMIIPLDIPNDNATNDNMFEAIGFSDAYATALGLSYKQVYTVRTTVGTYVRSLRSRTSESITWSAMNYRNIICMANESTFGTVSLSSIPSGYVWITIGGLTR